MAATPLTTATQGPIHINVPILLDPNRPDFAERVMFIAKTTIDNTRLMYEDTVARLDKSVKVISDEQSSSSYLSVKMRLIALAVSKTVMGGTLGFFAFWPAALEAHKFTATLLAAYLTPTPLVVIAYAVRYLVMGALSKIALELFNVMTKSIKASIITDPVVKNIRKIEEHQKAASEINQLINILEEGRSLFKEYKTEKPEVSGALDLYNEKFSEEQNKENQYKQPYSELVRPGFKIKTEAELHLANRVFGEAIVRLKERLRENENIIHELAKEAELYKMVGDEQIPLNNHMVIDFLKLVMM